MMKDNTNGVKVWIEIISATLLTLAAIGFAAGVLIVSLDFDTYRVPVFSFARAQYVLAGITWLATSIPVLIAPMALAAIWRFAIPSKKAQFVVYLVGPVVCGYTGYCLICQFSAFRSILLALFIILVEYAVFVPVVWLLNVYLPIPQTSSKQPHAKAHQTSKWAQGAFGVSCFLVLLMLSGLWILIYKGLVYPAISPSLGGGKHPTGVITLCSSCGESQEQLKQDMGPIELLGWSTKGAVIILDTNSDVVVLSTIASPHQSVSISRRLVDSIHYE